MDIYSDLKVDTISIVVKKKENSNFNFYCAGRAFDGFLFVTNGTGIFEFESQKTKISKNNLLILEKGDYYGVKALDDEFEYITTGYNITPQNGCKRMGLPAVMDLSGNPHTIMLIEKMLNVWESRKPLFTLRTRTIIEQMLLDLFDINGKATIMNRQNRLAPAIEYISRYYNVHITSEELAKLCGVSAPHFRRIFLEHTGKTPMQYREEIRIYWAKRMLESRILSISEIATNLGYFDIYHFSKDFKKHTGKSPTAYIQSTRTDR